MTVWAKYLISSNNPSVFLEARPFPSKVLAVAGLPSELQMRD